LVEHGVESSGGQLLLQVLDDGASGTIVEGSVAALSTLSNESHFHTAIVSHPLYFSDELGAFHFPSVGQKYPIVEWRRAGDVGLDLNPRE